MTTIQSLNPVHRRTYEKLAGEYEAKAAARSTGNLDRVKYVASFANGTNAIDVGCAVGVDINHFNNLGFQTTGIDLSKQMVEFAQKRNPSSRIINGDFFTHDFGKNFDVLFARAFIHLFPTKVAIEGMKKAKKVLNPNGIAFFGVTGSDTPNEGWKVKDDYSGGTKRYKKEWSLRELYYALVNVCGFEHLSTMEATDTQNKKRVGLVVRKPRHSIS